MPLIGTSALIQTIESYRLVWIAGRFSGGKTSISIRFAYEYLKRGYRLITNTPCIWSDDYKNVTLDENGFLHAVVIIDEAGLELKATRQVERMAAYAAKMDAIYLFPSYFPPIRSAQVVTIQSLFGFTQIGIPLQVYRWRVKLGAFEDKGIFFWAAPFEVWGLYSRRAPEGSIYQIIDTLSERVDDYRERYGLEKRNSVSGVEQEVSFLDGLQDAVSSMAEAADAIQTVSTRKHRRRGV